MGNILSHIDYLIEQVTPSQGSLIGQNIVAAVAPSLLTYTYGSPIIKNFLANKGVNDIPLIAGNVGTSALSLGTGLASGLAASGASAVASKLLKKYQEKRYGIVNKDVRTTGQKLTDAGITTARIATGTGSRLVAGAALGAAGINPTVLPLVATGMVANHYLQKPINAIQKRIQEKRALQQNKLIGSSK